MELNGEKRQTTPNYRYQMFCTGQGAGAPTPYKTSESRVKVERVEFLAPKVPEVHSMAADFWNMSEADRLRHLRSILVSQRRKLVLSVLETRAANAKLDEDGSVRGNELKEFQDQIAAIDRAIEDEERLAASFSAAAAIA